MTYCQRASENQMKLLQLLSMRRAGKCRSKEYMRLKRAAMRQYELLTREACERYRSQYLLEEG